MRVAAWHGANDLRVEERGRPALGPGDVLVRVLGCGICGTDQRIVAGHHRYYPAGTVRVPGHEIVGEVVDAGPRAEAHVKPGLVFVAPNIGCGVCRECRSGNNSRCERFQALGITLDGGFAEYVRVPAIAVEQGNLIPIAAGVDPVVATLIEPLACVIRGQDPLTIGRDDTVLVVGAGPIGILHVMLARLAGAEKVIIADRHAERIAFAEKQGADVGIDVRERDLVATIADATGGRGADAIVIAAPSPEDMMRAPDMAALGGRIAYFAGLPKEKSKLTLDANTIHYRELRVTGTTACSTGDCRRAAEIASSGKLDVAPLVTARIALNALPMEFSGRAGARIKTVMVP